jgi:hypothetical protein
VHPTDFQHLLLSPAFLGEQKQEGKMPQKRDKGDTEMLNTHTLPFSILLKHLSGLLSHERIHI